jgi:uncharacterized protein with WD repeat
MEFLAVTKDRIVIYDALSITAEAPDDAWYEQGLTADGNQVKVVATVPSPPNAFGHIWSPDGSFLASVTDDGAGIYDANKAYKEILVIPKVAPDVGGRSGGVRNIRFSPKNNFIVTYEKWDPLYPTNVHVWDLRKGKEGNKLHECTLKGYTSGALPVEIIKWTADESACLELAPGQGVILRPADLQVPSEDKKEEGGANWGEDSDEDDKPAAVVEVTVLPEKGCANYQIGKKNSKGQTFVACYIPEVTGGMVARVAVYDITNPKKPFQEVHMPAKVKDVTMLWNCEGSECLALASCDVDETNSSYFGTTFLYWITTEGKGKFLQVCGSKEGLVQDLQWSPVKNEFMAIVGSLPAVVALYDGKTGKQTSVLGTTRRNTLKWNRFGRFVAVGGFGALPGDIDFFDRSCEETVSSLRAALTVLADWAPDGQHLLCSTICPRMNEGNQCTIFRYSGERLLKIDFKPRFVEGRHEDTGGGARTKTQAILYHTSWRPCGPGNDKYEDLPDDTTKPAGKRKKGLPDNNEIKPAAGTASAYRPKGDAGYGGQSGGGGNLIAAMMRGEVQLPDAGKIGRGDGGLTGWETGVEAKPLEDWEIKKMQREAKKEAEKREQQAKDEEKELLRSVEKAVKDKDKKIKELKKALEEMEIIKEKEWDELTEEDEALLEGECDLRAQIMELEKGKA